jgi:CubicO group peptidase (beta-lactamase class C family)
MDGTMRPKKIFRYSLTSIILLIFLISPCLSQVSETQDPRKLIESYVTAFNTGEEAMRIFIIDNFSESALEQRSVNERIITYNQMRNDIVELTLKKIDETTTTSVSAVTMAKDGEWLIYTFTLELEPPNKIIRIRVEPTDEPETTSGAVLKENEALKTIGEYLKEQSSKDLFSGTALVAKDGKEIFKQAYGFANKEHNVPNKTDTKFNLGSINKIFTKIAIGQLYEQGKLDFSDPIIKFIPDYPNKAAAQKATIRHLLDMTSGIGDFFNDKFEATPKNKFRTNSDYLQMFAADPLQFEPGTQRQYSNGGYAILGVIIEKASEQSYYDYVREHIFKSSGMFNTDSYEADVPVPNMAEGYTRENPDQVWRINIYTRPVRGSAAGGGYSTTEDLLKFTIALEKGKFFTHTDTWSILQSEPTGQQSKSQSGLGIFGGAPGINAGIETQIGIGYTIIILANYDPPVVMDVMKIIRGLLKKVR